MHAVLLLFRPLQNVGIQNFDMWGMYNLGKAYRNIKKSIANRQVEDWEASNGHTKYTTRLFHGPWQNPVAGIVFGRDFDILTFLWPISHPFYPNAIFATCLIMTGKYDDAYCLNQILKVLPNCLSVILDKNNLNIYVCSHLGCGIDSIFLGVTNNSETQKWCK